MRFSVSAFKGMIERQPLIFLESNLVNNNWVGAAGIAQSV